MNLSAVLGIIALVLAFGATYALNYDFSAGKANPQFGGISPPFSFQPGDFISQLNAFFFVFIFSLLFFGYSAPIALAIEGARYASLLLKGTGYTFDMLFIFPEAIAAYSAIVLGQGVLNDVDGASVFEKWSGAVRYFVIAFALMVGLFVARMFLIKG